MVGVQQLSGQGILFLLPFICQNDECDTNRRSRCICYKGYDDWKHATSNDGFCQAWSVRNAPNMHRNVVKQNAAVEWHWTKLKVNYSVSVNVYSDNGMCVTTIISYIALFFYTKQLWAWPVDTWLAALIVTSSKHPVTFVPPPWHHILATPHCDHRPYLAVVVVQCMTSEYKSNRNISTINQHHEKNDKTKCRIIQQWPCAMLHKWTHRKWTTGTDWHAPVQVDYRLSLVTVENVLDLAGVIRNFIYRHRCPKAGARWRICPPLLKYWKIGIHTVACKCHTWLIPTYESQILQYTIFKQAF